MRRSLFALFAAVVLIGLGVSAGRTASAQSGAVTVTGILNILYGDPITVYTVTDPQDPSKQTQVLIDDKTWQASGIAVSDLNRQLVTVTGVSTGAGAQSAPAVSPGTLAVASIKPAGASAAAGPALPASGAQPYVDLLCKFSDFTTEQHPPSWYDTLMGNGGNGTTVPTVDNFFRDSSYGTITLAGSGTSSSWRSLPHPMSYYGDGTNSNPNISQNLKNMAQDCATVWAPYINFSSYIGLNFTFNGSVFGTAWGGTENLNLNGTVRNVGTTWFAPNGYGEDLSVWQHELGHALGLAHSGSDNAGKEYADAYDVMAYQYYAAPAGQPYNTWGQHNIGYAKDKLGWIPAARKFTYSSTSTRLTLGALGTNAGSNYLLAQIPYPGGPATHFYTVEFRAKVGSYENQLPLPATGAVIIHEVDTTRSVPAWVQGDGTATSGPATLAAAYQWTAGETWSGASGIQVDVISTTASSATIAIGAPPMRVSLSASAATPTANTSVTLTATSNFDVSPTPYYISIWDTTAGTNELTYCGSGTTCTTTVSGNGVTHAYTAYIGGSNGSNVQAQSNTVSVHWLAPFTVTLSASSTSAAANQNVTLTATSNQDVGPTEFYIDIWDTTAGTTPLTNCGNGTVCTTTVTGTNQTRSFTAYIAHQDGSSLQATSSTVSVAWGAAIPAPTVTSISPTSGPTSGGTSVTVNGTNFNTTAGATTVKFGTTAATGVGGGTLTCGASQCVVASPAGTAGTVHVTVTTSGGTSTTSAADQFTYQTTPTPTVSGVSPSSGPEAGGIQVTVTGSNFSTTSGGTTIKFGTTTATAPGCASSTSCAVLVPAGTGTVHVTATVAGVTSTTSSSDQFQYVPQPVISSISPTTGPAAGGTQITISGSNLNGASSVQFGTSAASGVSCTSSVSCVATSPSGSGTVHVTLTTTGGTSATSVNDQFTYQAAALVPTITNLSPFFGPESGHTQITVTGANFSTANGATTFSFGGTAALIASCGSSTLCSVVNAAGTGTVHVIATVAGQNSAQTSNDQFQYLPQPVVTGINPTSGPAAGGTQVMVSGSNLSASSVQFGSASATGVSCSSTSCTATSPAGSGTVHVTVTTNGGTSATSAADQFTYTAACQNPAKADITSPTGGSLTSGTPTFQWGGGSCITQYYFYAGSSVGQNDYYNSGQLPSTTTSATVSPAIPLDGRTVYVRLWSLVNGGFQAADHSYIMGACQNGTKADITSPSGGSITTGTPTFQWGGGACITQYYFYVGSSAGQNDLFSAGPLPSTSTSATVSPAIPVDGRTIYVRLWSQVNGSFLAVDHSYLMGACQNAAKADITSPSGGSITTGTPTFQWGGGSCVTQYYLYVGSSSGQNDLFSAGPLASTTTSQTISPAIPVDGRTIYVRLWSLVNGSFQAVDHSYLMGACANPTKADITSPAGGTVSSGTPTFTWGGGACVTQYYFYVGSSFGQNDLYSAGPLASTVTQATVSPAIPVDGRTIYVRLWSLVNGSFQAVDHSYLMGACANPSKADISSPVGSTLHGASQTFTWSGGACVTQYYLYIGSSFGQADLYSSGPLAGTVSSQAVTLPANNSTVYVRLWSLVNGTYQAVDHSYVSAP